MRWNQTAEPPSDFPAQETAQSLSFILRANSWLFTYRDSHCARNLNITVGQPFHVNCFFQLYFLWNLLCVVKIWDAEYTSEFKHCSSGHAHKRVWQRLEVLTTIGNYSMNWNYHALEQYRLMSYASKSLDESLVIYSISKFCWVNKKVVCSHVYLWQRLTCVLQPIHSRVNALTWQNYVNKKLLYDYLKGHQRIYNNRFNTVLWSASSSQKSGEEFVRFLLVIKMPSISPKCN
jgi:hypothetical protein